MTQSEIETELLLQKKMALVKFGTDWHVTELMEDRTETRNSLLTATILELETLDQQAQAMYAPPEEPDFSKPH